MLVSEPLTRRQKRACERAAQFLSNRLHSAAMLDAASSRNAWLTIAGKLSVSGLWLTDRQPKWYVFGGFENKENTMPVSKEYLVAIGECYEWSLLVPHSNDIADQLLEAASEYLDIYVLPWPRLNWLAAYTHEQGIGPYFIDFRQRLR